MSDFKILLVDDSPTMRLIIVNTLRRAGYENVVQAGDGKDALAKLKTEKFDFIITDWDMPEMDGSTFVTTVRADPNLKSLPILMVTTRAAKGDVEQAFKAGVDDYIVKPFTPDAITQKISQVLNLA